ncbi:hypothetical protein LAZ67_22001338 [Cordylochernes scorpioides]|uniref:Fibrinogen C-terminal domain-containing protein n=1 Tax=Cordylochernes scorpioides TaxID=51811 RepID=A0ABY6LNX6_9ARAC|nr:hypothetical protein LAZ67_22001338 [Cordylochernes scorpioides]
MLSDLKKSVAFVRKMAQEFGIIDLNARFTLKNRAPTDENILTVNCSISSKPPSAAQEGTIEDHCYEGHQSRDALSDVHNRKKWSTTDQDNDINSASCAALFKGGWWYGSCYHANLNGINYNGPHESNADGIDWVPFAGNHMSLAKTEMKIRPLNMNFNNKLNWNKASYSIQFKHKETSLIHFATSENHKPIQLHIFIHWSLEPDKSLIREVNLMDPETEIRRIKRLGLNLEKLAKEIEENAADCFELDAILKKILKIKQQFEQAYEYFIGIRDTDELLLQIEEVTDKYCKLEVKLLRFTQHIHNNANLPLSNNAVNKNYANLPKLELPFFDGKLENWISFSNVFKTTIIDNSQLTNIVKLQYLKTCLKGKALILVNHIPITENNFVLAWDLLEKRYDNKRDLIFNLIQRIIDLPKLTIESSTQLLFLVDNSYEIIRSLETLGYKLGELSDIIIGKILSDKLDKTTKRSWNMTVDNNHIPSSSELLKFIETYAKALNTSETERGLPLIKRSMKLQVHNLTKVNCFLCQQEHGIYLCPTFLDMEPLERRKKVKQLKLCFNCLRNNQSVNQCRSEFKCRKCQGKHNTLIHIDANIHQFKEHTVGIPAIEEPDKNQAESSLKGNNDALGVTPIHNTTCLMSNQEDSFVLLSTATIMVMNHQGKYQPCRALIDTDSQATLITRDCLKKLNLEPSRTRVELAGIGGQILDRTNGVINLNFTSHFNMSRIFKTNALVVDKVTSYMPYLKFEEHQFDHLQGLQLADPQYQYTAPIDILLGADIAFSLFKGAIKYGHEGPKLQRDIFPFLLRFRSHPIAISADITKMFRQILVHPEDTPYQRIIWRDESGWIFCFFYNCRKPLKKENSGALSLEEIETSLNRIIRCAQQEDYYIDLRQLEALQPLSGKGPLIKLNHFLDKVGLLRVDGRSDNAFLRFVQKHPIILPKAHYITQLVITHYHGRLLHAGVQLTLSAIREKYWIPSRRCLVKQILFKCIKCARFRTKPVQQLMGNSPKSRINWTRPFTKTGIDFAGPVIVKTSNLRKAKVIKWNFIPPYSHHFRGLWEAGIKSAKYHLRRIVGKTKLTVEELTTVLTQIEACLNSRPFCPLTDDPEDLTALTAGHFLIGMPLTAVLSLVRESGSSLRGRWRLVDQIKTDF